MYRVEKVLNHNVMIAVNEEDMQEYLIMGKGIGFGKKVSERLDGLSDVQIYSLVKTGKEAQKSFSAKGIDPLCLEAANMLLEEAEKRLGKVDKSAMIPLADHIEFALKRMKEKGEISNPLTQDIKVLFHGEYKVAEGIRPFLQKEVGLEIGESEVGYIALHVHSAITEEKVSSSLQIAKCVRECISMIEKEIGHQIPVVTLSYNRLMNHVRYMVLRCMQKEEIKISMNDYMELRFEKSYRIAGYICKEMGEILKQDLHENEIGYLAIHIQRCIEEIEEEKNHVELLQ